MRPGRPVRGMVNPLSAGWFRTLSGVSPWANLPHDSPLFKSIAVMRPYGGLTSGKPLNGDRRSAASAAGRAGRCAGSALRWARPDSAPCPRMIRHVRPLAVGRRRARGRRDLIATQYTYRCASPDRTSRPASSRRPSCDGIISVASGPSHLADDGRREERADLVARHELQASARSSGVKSIRSSMVTPAGRTPAAWSTNGCVGAALLPARRLLRPARSSIGQTGWPVARSKHIDPGLLGRLRERLDRRAVHRDVGEDRRARDVQVPDAVVHELVVPPALAGLQVDGDDALAEQAVARADGRRSSRPSAVRRAGRRGRAPRRRSSAPRRRCCPV